MATNIPEFRTRLLAERAAVVAEIAVIDLPDETAKIEAANEVFSTAQVAHHKAARRWELLQEKLNRLEVLDEQIEMFTPAPPNP